MSENDRLNYYLGEINLEPVEQGKTPSLFIRLSIHFC